MKNYSLKEESEIMKKYLEGYNEDKKLCIATDSARYLSEICIAI